ncbi:O-acetyl-ADP-ribose deacetylase [Dyadobacter sandarakinus]|uniref:O-acetyl-ADP-ribose deacetylase n=1 Tax=Dyadobacter sandarakinus TaxID=2747268 RepID=A0ABX7I7U9_9BACT|nr:O-acetyl-ADP-ribose deacetylase [Dyadobacter sandarakinus]QRR02177.1 O-acetyl-ADP-ribose deacetylase [Dyadobacter sandarakinus]
MDQIIELIKGDITQLKVDAIVNAAKSSLLGGGGVDGAIHRAGGPQILEECRKIVARQGSCSTGDAVITSAGKLPARYVIHTVGPVWQGGSKGEPEKLASCYARSMELATAHGCRSIAFPNISTGIYGYPKEQAAKVAVEAVTAFLLDHPGQIDRVVFICFDQENYLHLAKIPGVHRPSTFDE